MSIVTQGGSFVCKLFDMNNIFTISVYYLCHKLFQKVTITKPVTSRPASSERYLVCQGLHQ